MRPIVGTRDPSSWTVNVIVVFSLRRPTEDCRSRRIYDSRNHGSSLFLAVLLCSDAKPAARTVAANYAAR